MSGEWRGRGYGLANFYGVSPWDRGPLGRMHSMRASGPE